MGPRATPLAAVLVAAWLPGCNDTRDLAPATPNSPWEVTVEAANGSRSFSVPQDPSLPWPGEAASVVPDHRYTLAELIDIAERRNRTTRIAWEAARQAAIGVGMAQAAYLPTLTAVALAGYQRAATPFPPTLDPRGYITANAQEFLPELAAKYLLLDFGSRRAGVDAARQLSFAANVAFTGAHQALILSVARAYLTLDGVDAAVTAARQSLVDAGTLRDGAEAARTHGLGTIVEVAVARRGVAQAQVELAYATTAQHDARLALLVAMDMPPDTRLAVASCGTVPLSPQTGATVDRLMHEALQRRPDLLASLARVRAADAGVALARSAMMPKLTLDANVQGNIGRVSVDGDPYESVAQPQAGVFLAFTWPLYSGGLLGNELRLAESRRAAAADALAQASEDAVRQVALAYDAVDDGLAQYRAAAALQNAAAAAFAAAHGAYVSGMGTFTDAAQTQSALATARASLAHAHAQALINAAVLAYAVGGLTSSQAPGLPANGS